MKKAKFNAWNLIAQANPDMWEIHVEDKKGQNLTKDDFEYGDLAGEASIDRNKVEFLNSKTIVHTYRVYGYDCDVAGNTYLVGSLRKDIYKHDGSGNKGKLIKQIETTQNGNQTEFPCNIRYERDGDFDEGAKTFKNLKSAKKWCENTTKARQKKGLVPKGSLKWVFRTSYPAGWYLKLKPTKGKAYDIAEIYINDEAGNYKDLRG